MALTSYSQCGEDVIINFLFRSVLGIDEIEYLDIGSNDPVEFNNTYLFYKQGYRGMSIDANPFFTSQYKEGRGGDIFVCAGVGSNDRKAPFYVIDPHTLSTFSEDEAKRYTETGYHQLVKTEIKKILSINTILKKYFKRSLPNFLSVDVEGYDLEILQSIDFTSWRPTVICAETLTYTTNSSEQKISEIFNFLENNNYRVYADTYVNTVFVDNEKWRSRK